MPRYIIENDQEETPQRRVRKKRPPQTPAPRPAAKTSYESNADVQRWLLRQALEDGGTRPPFEPTFLAGMRDRLWILSSFAHFYEQHLISDVLGVVKSGKEATVYCCAADPQTGWELLAAKVYRPRMFRSLKNDVVYRDSRTQRDNDGRVVRGERQDRAQRKTARRKESLVTSWIEFEYETQQLLHAAGAKVPEPLGQVGNAVLMEYIGTSAGPALLLREVNLPQAEAQPLWEQLLGNIELFLRCNRIHGDLSAYNILYLAGEITIIDFAQAVDPRHSDNALPLLTRDIERVHGYFAPYGVLADPAALAAEMWGRCVMNG